jgi:HK97 gp10 family phage protein
MIDFDFNPSIAALNKELDKLEDGLKTKAVRAGLSKSAAPLKKKMKADAPDRTGRLSKSIGHQTLSGKRKQNALLLVGKGQKDSTKLAEDQYAIIVGPNRKVRGVNPSYYAHILEFGARSHSISIRKKNLGKAMRMSKTTSNSSSFFFAKGSVSHPGIKAQGWMARAHDAATNDINTGFYTGLSRYLDRL